MKRAAEYILSSYSFIRTDSLDQLLNVGYQSKEGNPIPSFDEDLLIEMCSDARSIFENENNVLEIEGDVIIVGDIHGSFHDLLRILKYIQQKNTKVLFLGDYVDRGNFSLECITLLFALKIMEPEKYFLLRGNHEFDSICSQYGFLNEIINYHNPKKTNIKESPSIKSSDSLLKLESWNCFLDNEKTSSSTSDNSSDDLCEEYSNLHKEMNCYKYTKNLYDAFIKAFTYLPIAAIVNKTNFCIHGGLSRQLTKVDQLNNIIRPIHEFEENDIISDVVWSDPCTVLGGLFSENPRGRGCLYSRKATIDFLNENSLKRLIRAHECVKHGSTYNFLEKCITVFSASSYTKGIENNSGILKLFEKDNSIKFVTFHPIQRLEKSDTIYYKVQAFHEKCEKIRLCFSFRHPQLASKSAVRLVKNKNCCRLKSLHAIPTQCGQMQLSRFVTSKNDVMCQKKFLSHSVSVDEFDSKSGNKNEAFNLKIRNLKSFDDLPSLND